jgi:hypothetical protein
MNHDDVFERLEPPPGGLATLRARLASRPSVLRRVAPPLAFAVAAVAIVVFLAGRRRASDPLAEARQKGDGAEVLLGLAPMPKVPVTVDAESRATTALAEVKTANPNVAFYWISSTDWRD